jgi:hypothetical protein
MPSLRLMMVIRILCVTVFVLCTVSCTRAQKRDTHFPTDDEIRLVLTQTERAVTEYKLLLDMEEKVFGKEGSDAVVKDRETVRGLDAAITGFRKDPQAFNGPMGFAFFEWLDDAGRNALLSSVSASSTGAAALIDGDTEKARSNLELAKDLGSVSTTFYTVSENAGALYARYVEGEEELATQGLKVATDCANILKKKKEADSKP